MRISNVVFHPVLMVLYGSILMMMANPFAFGANSLRALLPQVALMLFSTVFIPSIALFMMQRLKIFKQEELNEQQKLIAPIFIMLILYSSLYISLRPLEEYPQFFHMYMLGFCVAAFLCLFFNSFVRISVYTAAISSLLVGLLMQFILQNVSHIFWSGMAYQYYLNFVAIILCILLAAGWVGSMRLSGQQNNTQSLAYGYIIGALSQIVSAGIYNL